MQKLSELKSIDLREIFLMKERSRMGINLYRAYDELLYKPINIVIPMAGAGSRFAIAVYLS